MFHDFKPQQKYDQRYYGRSNSFSYFSEFLLKSSRPLLEHHRTCQLVSVFQFNASPTIYQ